MIPWACLYRDVTIDHARIKIPRTGKINDLNLSRATLSIISGHFREVISKPNSFLHFARAIVGIAY